MLGTVVLLFEISDLLHLDVHNDMPRLFTSCNLQMYLLSIHMYSTLIICADCLGFMHLHFT